ncbi:MAG TPA: SDR family NAD(P)-dependent oxidoreductase, partial [Cellvibrionaceae bacterium]|nr:SDR family NAD(P)-dependent oxidoreductase [Cellvibrionaceae bacterium]
MQNTKIALITGGSRGLGKNMAIHLAKRGRDIIFTYHSNEQQAQATLAELSQLGVKALALQLDI